MSFVSSNLLSPLLYIYRSTAWIDVVKQCPIVNEQFQQGRVTISAVKNKIDRIFRITLV